MHGRSKFALKRQLMVLRRCKNYQLANLFPARAVALGCLYVVMEERGLRTANARDEWVDDVASRKVDNEDFEEVVELLKRG